MVEIKEVQNGKEKVNVQLFKDYIRVQISGLKNSTRELPHLTNIFSEVTGNKVNPEK